MASAPDSRPPALPLSWLVVRTQSGRRWMIPGARVLHVEPSSEADETTGHARTRLIRHQWVGVQDEVEGRAGALPLARGADDALRSPWMVLVLHGEPPLAVRVQVERLGAHALEGERP